MLLIYIPRVTNRAKYAFNLLFRDLLGINYQLSSDAASFIASTQPKISYADKPVGDELFFQSRSILSESGINQQNITVFDWDGTKAFFAAGKSSVLPFDVFAATFYLASRYEEYLPHIRDEYDRFDAPQSLAYQNDFLQKPLINIWALKLKSILAARFPSLVFPERKYRYISTIDIDNAFAYKEKGFVRTLGGYAKSLSVFDLKEVAERTRVLFGSQRDPYDTYQHQLAIQERYGLKPVYFFLMADYGVNDKNVPVNSRKFQSLIKSIGDYAQVGIHPSFASNSNPASLRKEISTLSKILHREVTSSRQHFLKLRLPDTYRNLIEHDITDDYSMGFASRIGFRASICTPFTFYDLDQETETKLRIHPFAVMDATLKYYMKIPPEQAVEQVLPLINEVKQVKGDFMSLWHNESLSDQKQWADWQPVYEGIVKAALA